MTTPRFHGGADIALKLPRAEFDRTLAFYRDVLGMEVSERQADGVARSVSLPFGPATLWLDRVDNYARADVWLELFTGDVPAAMRHLAAHGVEPRDELEVLPRGLEGHWVANPAGITHLVRRPDGTAHGT